MISKPGTHWSLEACYWLCVLLAGKPEVLDSKSTVITAAAVPQTRILEKWEIQAERACGAPKTAISHELRVLIRDCEDNPLLIWDTPKASFVQQKTAPCFNAYHTLLSTQMRVPGLTH